MRVFLCFVSFIVCLAWCVVGCFFRGVLSYCVVCLNRYGDVVPVTGWGKLIASMAIVCGILTLVRLFVCLFVCWCVFVCFFVCVFVFSLRV